MYVSTKRRQWFTSRFSVYSLRTVHASVTRINISLQILHENKITDILNITRNVQKARNCISIPP
jgi:hypothetical protein